MMKCIEIPNPAEMRLIVTAVQEKQELEKADCGTSSCTIHIVCCWIWASSWRKGYDKASEKGGV